MIRRRVRDRPRSRRDEGRHDGRQPLADRRHGLSAGERPRSAASTMLAVVNRPLAHVMAAAALAACSDPAAVSPTDADTPDVAVDAASDGPADAPEGGPQDAAAIGRLFAFTASSDGKIRVFAVDDGTGAWTARGSVSAGAGPSFVAMDPKTSRVFAVDEAGGNVLSFAFDAAAGSLTPKGPPVASQGAGPTHVSVDATGAWVLVANYTAGSAAVFPILPTGALGAASSVTSPGNEAHLAITNPSGGFAFVPCLGSNFIAQYTFDASQGKLAPNTPAVVSAPPSAGPRHLAFHPSEKFAYGINETASTMSAYAFDVGTGRLTLVQTLSTLPSNFSGANTGAEVAVHPSGAFVYGSNRGHDSIVTFAVNAGTGQLTLVGHEPTGGKTPRSFAVDPAGSFLFAANQDSGTVTGFRLDPVTGKPVPLAGPATAVPSPTFVGAWRVP